MSNPTLVFVWSTKNALQRDCLPIFLDYLQMFADVDADLLFRCRICLYEGATNALIHGNLDLHQGMTDMASLASRHQEIAARLADEALARKCLILIAHKSPHGLDIWVVDEGAGIAENAAHKETAFGRGKALLHEFADMAVYDNASRTLKLTFYQGEYAASRSC